MTQKSHRSTDLANRLIGISISYERSEILARGLGVGHLRDMLLRIARPLLRQSASIAFGGRWTDEPEFFTFDLLRLIADEQTDNSIGGPDSNLTIGKLVNHLAWPHYLDMTRQLEATWIHACRIVRVTQEDAGFEANDVVPDGAAKDKSDRSLFHAAVTLSAMRRLITTGMRLCPPSAPPERIPPIAARISLGGKLRDYLGFMPGIWEEALGTLEANRPLFLLGGFGGAAGYLADALTSDTPLPQEFDHRWHAVATPLTARLQTFDCGPRCPPDVRRSDVLFAELRKRVESARGQLSTTLRTGLTEEETRTLLTSYDISQVAKLVLKGLETLQRQGAM